MDITTTLSQIIALDIQDRIRLVQGILDRTAAEQVDPDLTEPQNANSIDGLMIMKKI